VRGGEARGVSVGGAVFRVRRFGDLALLLVQWALVLFGLFLVLTALNVYAMETTWASHRPKPLLGQDYFIPPTWQRMIGGVTTGLIAMGLGAVLFYLRRLYLARRQ
jgi:ABC-type Fe3+ transport system permease subunit